MLKSLTEFVDELRAVGIPVSMVEAIDAAEALRHAELADREAVRAALQATMVKNGRHLDAFDTAFDVFFGLRARPFEPPDEDEAGDTDAGEPGAGAAGGSGGSGGDPDAEALIDGLLRALQGGDQDALRRLLAEAVTRLAGMEPGRPVGGRYYLYRVSRRLDLEGMVERLLEAARLGAGGRWERLDERLARQRAEQRVEELRVELRREIVRRLVADRGVRPVARTLRLPLVEDVDLMHATRDELVAIERVVEPLGRKLASRLTRRRKRGKRGRLDVRKTIRRSLAHGGALVEPRFRAPRIAKPELVLLCDVSGSMATFARFTMQLTYAISSQFSRVRTFAFIDGLDEVTGFFGPGVHFHDALLQMGTEADLVRSDGHSDYGRSLGEFWTGYSDAVGAKTTVIVTGDARNNYRETGEDVLAAIAGRARQLFWLNPEPRRYWDTGDSILSVYAPHCTSVRQVRTLRELEAFVESVALPGVRVA